MAAVTCMQVFTDSSQMPGRSLEGGAGGFVWIHWGSVDPSAGEWKLHRNSQPRVGHIQAVKPDGTSRGSNLTGPHGAQRAAWGPGWLLREGPGVREAPRSPRVPEGGIRHMDLSPTCPGLRFPGSMPPCRVAAPGAVCPLVEQVWPPSERPWTVERRLEAQEDRWGCSTTSPAGEGGGLGPAAQAGGYPRLGRCVHEAPSVHVYQANRQVRRLVPSTGAEQGQSEGVCPSGVHPGPAGAEDPDTRSVTPGDTRRAPGSPRRSSVCVGSGRPRSSSRADHRGVATPQGRPGTGQPWGAALGGSQQEGCLWSEAFRGL